MQSTILRAHLETVLNERIATPFTDVRKRICETVPSGIDVLDSAIGGLRRGAITEIFGLPSSGKTSMLLSILAAANVRNEVCALVDGSDAFSPASGARSGIDLKRLLWVRCHSVEQTIKVTDLLLQSGGFGVVALDVSDLQLHSLQSVPLATWFRFQRAIEKTPTILAIVSQHGVAKTCASLALQLESNSVGHWKTGGQRPLQWGRLLEKLPITAEIVRNRQTELAQSHVCFSFHSEFCSSGARP
jgi:hypothetical protein